MAGPSQHAHLNDSASESPRPLDEETSDVILRVGELKLSVKQEDENIGHLTVPPHYLEMQCPFTWEECNFLDGVKSKEVMLTKLERTGSSEFRIYCYTLSLGCLCGFMNEEEEALKNFNSCEELLDNLPSEIFHEAIVPGMKHMINASRCHLYFKIGKPTIAAEISSTVPPFEDLSNESKACVWAVKAYILSDNGYDGKVKAFECAKLAIELDPDEDGSRKGAWYYIAGKIMGEIRRIVSGDEIPTKEELKYLERSTRNNPFPVHYAVLADSYRESSKLVLKNHNNYAMAGKLSEGSLKLYKKALEGNGASFPVLMRCAAGLTKLPKKFRDVKLAENTLKLALSIDSENGELYMLLGNIEDWHRNDSKAALKYFEKAYECGKEFAALKIVKIKYQLDNSYNPLDDCEKYISATKESMNADQTNKKVAAFLAVKGEYFLHVKKDLLNAAREWEKTLDIAPESRSVQEYYCLFNPGSPRWNLYEALRKLIVTALSSLSLSDADTDYLKGLLRKYEKVAET